MSKDELVALAAGISPDAGFHAGVTIGGNDYALHLRMRDAAGDTVVPGGDGTGVVRRDVADSARAKGGFARDALFLSAVCDCLNAGGTFVAMRDLLDRAARTVPDGCELPLFPGFYALSVEHIDGPQGVERVITFAHESGSPWLLEWSDVRGARVLGLSDLQKRIAEGDDDGADALR